MLLNQLEELAKDSISPTLKTDSAKKMGAFTLTNSAGNGPEDSTQELKDGWNQDLNNDKKKKNKKRKNKKKKQGD